MNIESFGEALKNEQGRGPLDAKKILAAEKIERDYNPERQRNETINAAAPTDTVFEVDRDMSADPTPERAGKEVEGLTAVMNTFGFGTNYTEAFGHTELIAKTIEQGARMER